MENLRGIGFLVLLFGVAILTWTNSLSRKKFISNGQEASFSVVAIVFLLLGILMIAVPF